MMAELLKKLLFEDSIDDSHFIGYSTDLVK